MWKTIFNIIKMWSMNKERNVKEQDITLLNEISQVEQAN